MNPFKVAYHIVAKYYWSIAEDYISANPRVMTRDVLTVMQKRMSHQIEIDKYFGGINE